MASYTDKAPTFSPYVAQKPVEIMAKVGMQKQAQYEQGYKKIQDSIDNIAGLDIVRPQDKAHLQTKLNELGTKLQGVAAADFSNLDQPLKDAFSQRQTKQIRTEDLLIEINVTGTKEDSLVNIQISGGSDALKLRTLMDSLEYIQKQE